MHKTIFLESYLVLIRWLKACRKAKGFTMRTTAKKLGLSHSWIEKIEQAERRLDIAEYARLCQILKINPHKGLDILTSAMKSDLQKIKKKTKNNTT